MNYLNAYDVIRVELGGSLPSSIAARDIADMAGNYLLAMHPWKWAVSRTGLIDLRGKISVTAGTWTEATKTLTETGTFANYTHVERDQIKVTAGTGATTGFYEIASRTDDDNIVLSTSIGAAADGSADIAGSMDLNSVALPSDFGQLIDVAVSDSIFYKPQLVTLSEILDNRVSGIEVSGDWYYKVAIAYVGSPAEPILEIYPSPESNQVGEWTVLYRQRWVTKTSDSASLQVPDVGPYRMLYQELLKAVARGYAESDEGSLDQRLVGIEQGPTFRAAKQMDGLVQPHFGTIRGGGASLHGRSGFSRRAWLASVVGNPSS